MLNFSHSPSMLDNFLHESAGVYETDLPYAELIIFATPVVIQI
jgi:hypothetical protein